MTVVNRRSTSSEALFDREQGRAGNLHPGGVIGRHRMTGSAPNTPPTSSVPPVQGVADSGAASMGSESPGSPEPILAAVRPEPPKRLSFANESEPLPACLSHLQVSAI
jgi:hypothetical protein